MDISVENFKELLRSYQDDRKVMNRIVTCLNSFAEYHAAIFEMETKLMAYTSESLDRAELQELHTSLDSARTTRHNAMLVNVNILNRLAEKNGIGAIYGGVVSEERPYRREVANAVLAFVENVVKNRS